MDDSTIEQGDGCSFGQQQVFANSVEKFILYEK